MKLPQPTIGVFLAPKSWGPQLDKNIAREQGQLRGAHGNGDLATRSLDPVEYVVPATSRPQSIFAISEAQVEQIGFVRGDVEDASWYTSSGPQINASCKALFDKDVRAKLPYLKAHILMGVATITFCVTPPWITGHEDTEAGGGLVNADRFFVVLKRGVGSLRLYLDSKHSKYGLA
ncbi:hypothetical protein C8Q74DRAFT_989700 [Fomes fomentarius]|nr:hypothetical protein C8Q74DRAFT_989700 [Fomes fomentarius]